MSLRDADIRFLLPRLPRTMSVYSGLDATREGLAQAGLTLVEHAPDLAVLAAADAARALASEPAAIVVLGRGGARAVRGQMQVSRRFVALPGVFEPHLIVPVDRPRVAAYAVRTWTASESRLRRARNEGAAAVIALRAFPDLARSLTLGLRDPGSPAFVAAAEALGVPAGADWFLTLGLGDALTRAVFHVFAPQAAEPSWVLKFSRVAGYDAPFERDERGLGIAADAGGVAAARAPRLLGRLELDGLPGSLEQAAPGRRLTFVLQAPGRRRAKLRVIDAVAGWVVQLGRETAAAPETLAVERRRLEREVLAPWLGAGVPPDLVARIPEVPAVLQHNDLGAWNLIARGDGFTAVDWESARAHGLPLWDLLYFLVDALVHLDGAWEPGAREAHAARLLRGEAGSAEILFGWIWKALDSLSIPLAAVGPIVTLGWLHHGLSPDSRAATAGLIAPGPVSQGTYGEWMARVWLTTPGLGPGWQPPR